MFPRFSFASRNPAGDVRIFFSLPAGIDSGALQIDTCSEETNYDSYFWLLDSGGNLVAENDGHIIYILYSIPNIYISGRHSR